jgi:hypothetical protein
MKIQLRQLQAPMTALTLNRLGYPKSLSRTDVFGSRFYGGLEFASLTRTQGAGKLILLLRHLRTPGQPQNLSHIVLDRFQYNAGVGYHILENTQLHLPHLEGVWIPTVREYLTDINGSLQISTATIQPLQRQGDKYIMDLVLASNLFKARDMKFLNCCRLYLQVLTLSDMYNAQGNALAVGIYDGYRSHTQSRSTLLEPFQERPNSQVWSLWRRFLRQITIDGCWAYDPLGWWYAGISTRRQWQSYFSPSQDLLYWYDCNDLICYPRIAQQNFSAKRTSYTTVTLPIDAIPVDISDIDEGWYMFSPMLPDKEDSDTMSFPSFTEYIQSLPDHESLLLQQMDLRGQSIYDVCNAMQSLSDIILVSDGGAMDDYGFFGWVVSTKGGDRLATGFGSDPRSYRAEGHGAKAGTLFIIHCFWYCNFPIPPGQFTFYCDNQGLLKKLTYLRSYNNAIHATVLHLSGT